MPQMSAERRVEALDLGDDVANPRGGGFAFPLETHWRFRPSR
jgi:hypothetical protein